MRSGGRRCQGRARGGIPPAHQTTRAARGTARPVRGRTERGGTRYRRGGRRRRAPRGRPSSKRPQAGSAAGTGRPGSARRGRKQHSGSGTAAAGGRHAQRVGARTRLDGTGESEAGAIIGYCQWPRRSAPRRPQRRCVTRGVRVKGHTGWVVEGGLVEIWWYGCFPKFVRSRLSPAQLPIAQWTLSGSMNG